jgi:hypothetical protein
MNRYDLRLPFRAFRAFRSFRGPNTLPGITILSFPIHILQIELYHPNTGKRLPVAGVPDGAVTLMEFEVEE